MPTSHVPPLAVAAAVGTAATSLLLFAAAARGALGAAHSWSTSRLPSLDTESRQLEQLGAVVIGVLSLAAAVVGVALVVSACTQARRGAGPGGVRTAAVLHVPVGLLAVRYLTGEWFASGAATAVAVAVLLATGLVWWATYDRRCGAWRQPTPAPRRPGAFT